MPAEWTLDELVDRVGAALDAAGYPGAPNGRVREVPDRRSIRWYTTIGLLDRPAAMRGRTALYGERHLRQLVAIKRLQARGRSLAEIQAELVGATDEVLWGIADRVDATGPAPATPGSASAEPELASAAPGSVQAASAAPAARSTARTFWTRSPAAPAPAAPAPAAPAPLPVPATPLPVPATPLPVPAAPLAVPVPTAPAASPGVAAPGGVLTGVPLDGGVVLLLPAAPDPDDLPAVRAAARPLIDLLTARGLLAGPSRRSAQ